MRATPVVFLVLLALLFPAACWGVGPAPKSTTFPERIHGIAHPRLAVTLKSQVAGTLRAVPIKEGQTVKEGSTLATLDDSVARAQLRIAELHATRRGELDRTINQLQLAKRQLSRLEMAFERHAVSDFELEEQRARVEDARATHAGQLEVQQLAKANLELAHQQLQQLTIRAPFTGVVTRLHIRQGASIDPSLALVDIADLGTLEVAMHTPLEYFGRIQQGANIPVFAGAPVHRQIEATVAFASPIINAASGTFRVVLHIDNTTRTLPAGFPIKLLEAAPRTPAPPGVAQ